MTGGYRCAFAFVLATWLLQAWGGSAAQEPICLPCTCVAGVLKSCPDIPLIDLRAKGIVSLAPDCLAKNANLKKLSITSNFLSSLPSGLLEKCPGLEVVNFQDNSLRQLPGGLFDNNKNLTSVNLNTNQLTILPHGLFDFSHKLSSLFVQSNNLLVLQPRIFDKTILRTLNVSGNPVLSTPNKACGLKSFYAGNDPSGRIRQYHKLLDSQCNVTDGSGVGRSVCLTGSYACSCEKGKIYSLFSCHEAAPCSSQVPHGSPCNIKPQCYHDNTISSTLYGRTMECFCPPEFRLVPNPCSMSAEKGSPMDLIESMCGGTEALCVCPGFDPTAMCKGPLPTAVTVTGHATTVKTTTRAPVTTSPATEHPVTTRMTSPADVATTQTEFSTPPPTTPTPSPTTAPTSPVTSRTSSQNDEIPHGASDTAVGIFGAAVGALFLVAIVFVVLVYRQNYPVEFQAHKEKISRRARLFTRGIQWDPNTYSVPKLTQKNSGKRSVSVASVTPLNPFQMPEDDADHESSRPASLAIDHSSLQERDVSQGMALPDPNSAFVMYDAHKNLGRQFSQLGNSGDVGYGEPTAEFVNNDVHEDLTLYSTAEGSDGGLATAQLTSPRMQPNRDAQCNRTESVYKMPSRKFLTDAMRKDRRELSNTGQDNEKVAYRIPGAVGSSTGQYGSHDDIYSKSIRNPTAQARTDTGTHTNPSAEFVTYAVNKNGGGDSDAQDAMHGAPPIQPRPPLPASADHREVSVYSDSHNIDEHGEYIEPASPALDGHLQEYSTVEGVDKGEYTAVPPILQRRSGL